MVTSTFCYDGADRLLQVLGGGAATFTFDSRGNVTSTTTAAGTTWFVYDAMNRHVKTVGPNGSGGTVTVTYTRDVLDRIITRTVSGSTTGGENGTFKCGYTTLDDSADLDVTSAGVLTARTIGLPGGVLLVKDYTTPGNTRWQYPNIHGDLFITLTGTGVLDGGLKVYDPYGQPITTINAIDPDLLPDTTPGGFDYGWLGQHQRGTEHTGTLNYLQMGASVYDPTTGRFYSIDPVPGGGPNNYAYPTDPVNGKDLDGKRWRNKVPNVPYCQYKGQKRCVPNDRKAGISKTMANYDSYQRSCPMGCNKFSWSRTNWGCVIGVATVVGTGGASIAARVGIKAAGKIAIVGAAIARGNIWTQVGLKITFTVNAASVIQSAVCF